MVTKRRPILVAACAATLCATLAPAAHAARAAGPSVKAAGVGTEAALSSPKCETSTGLTKMNFTARPPCVRPLGADQRNGGATSRGVSKDAIKVVVLVPDSAQQEAGAKEPGATPPVDQATGSLGTLEDGFRDFFEVFAHWTETWGRDVELEFVNPSGADETAQRADALKVAEMEPFAVVDAAGANGGGAVFGSVLAAQEFLVITSGGGGEARGSNDDAIKQAPYRWGNQDTGIFAINAGEFVAKTLSGRKAEWAGDEALQSETRKLAVVYPVGVGEVDIAKFDKAFRTFKGKGSITTVPYDLGDDPSAVADEAQRLAPQVIAKVKDSGATSVVLFTDIVNMTPAVMKAATTQDYFPEWVITGLGFQDIDFVARLLWPAEQTAHVFGIGASPPYAADGSSANGLESFFDSYWGDTQGTYAPVAVGIGFLLFSGIQLAGPGLTPETFEQGVFSMPAAGGAIDGQISNFMNAYGRGAGVPYDEYQTIGVDYAMKWWDPEAFGVSNLVVGPPAAGKFTFLNGAERYYAGEWPTGNQRFFDRAASIAQLDAPPPGDAPPNFPCDGCPSARDTASQGASD
jgi:hypothetical protein